MGGGERAAPPRARVLALTGISRQYGTEPAVHALRGVELVLDRGDWLAVTGPSGAGKSTLLNIIGCLDQPSSGHYFLDGIDTTCLSDTQRAGLRSQRIGFVFQSFHLLPYRTVLENVMLAEVYRKQSGSGRRERALAAIARVGLSHRADYSPLKLSGGERQRVAIARALVGSPSLLLCDEPTGNLDSASTAAILDLFEKLNREGVTIVVVTHDEHVAARASRRVHIVDGTLTDRKVAGDRRTRPGPAAVPSNSGVASSDPVVAPSDSVVASSDPAVASSSPIIALSDPIVAASSPVVAPSSPANAPSTLAVAPATPAVARSGMTFSDLMNETLAGMFARPGRMVLTVLGIVIGLTALVATLGLTRTAGNRIISQFDRLAATELFISGRPGKTTGIVDARAIPWDAPARLRRLNGVVAAGTLSDIDTGDELVRASAVQDPLSQSAYKLALRAASPDLFRAVRAQLRAGRLPDAGHSRRADRVAVLGPDAARNLGIEGVEQLPAIYIGDHLYLVLGILRDVGRKPELLGSVIIPEGTARQDFNLAGPGTVIVETRIGAAYLIADQARLALRPDDPRALKVEVPQEPRRVRDEVQTDLNVMFLLLGGLSLVVGAIGIANITLVGVMERTAEIGLRRAIGATRGHIAAQFLFESAAMGVIGGVIGASLGVLIVVIVSAFQVWTPVLDPLVPLLAPLAGGVIGVLSGTYPAYRAARLEPVEAFRH